MQDLKDSGRQPTISLTMVKTQSLQKSFGRVQALDRVSVEVRDGEAAALIGPNGAGKSTLLRILATLSRPDGGTASVGGHDVATNREAIRPILGYLPDDFGLYPEMTVGEFLGFFASAYGVPKAEREKLVGELLELTGLTDFRDRRGIDLSRGIQQRVCLAKTLINRPKILLLDEPCSALDPAERVSVLALLKELRRMGTTIFLTSHILHELPGLCDSVILMEKGRVVAQGKLDHVFDRYGCRPRLSLGLDGHWEKAQRVAEEQVFVRTVQRTDGGLDVFFDGAEEEVVLLVKALAAADVPIRYAKHHPPDMNTLFLQATEGKVQ